MTASWLGVLLVSWRRIAALGADARDSPWPAVPLTTGAAVVFAALGGAMVAVR